MTCEIPLAVILGCAGTKLTSQEQQLFKEINPFGLILFARNCANPDQIKALTSQFRDVIGQKNAPVFIDQEGGRVTRLKQPWWRHPPPAHKFVELANAKGDDVAIKAIRLNSRLIAKDLKTMGISVNCAPVLDIHVNSADPIVGDRALGGDIERIEKLGAALCSGLLSDSVLPVIKHIPGHGRALVDSHRALPTVDAQIEQLMEMDFEPFRRLNKMPLAMTAHVIFSKIDGHYPATVSPKVIEEVIRGYIAFDGLLISDDLSMQALSGDFKERAKAALGAGCDVVLHCNGKMDEMVSVVAGAQPMTDTACRRWLTAVDLLPKIEPLDPIETLAQFNHLMKI